MYEGAARAREVWSPLPAGREAGEAQTAHSWSPRPWPWSQLSHKLTGVLRRFLALCVSSTGRMAQLISEERGSLRLRRPRTDKRRLRVDQGRHGTQFREDTPPHTHTPERFSRNGSQSELLLQQEGQESDVRQYCAAAPPFSSGAHRKNKAILSPRNRSAILAVPTVQGAAPSLVSPLSTLDQSRPCHSAPGQSWGGSGRDRRGPCSAPGRAGQRQTRGGQPSFPKGMGGLCSAACSLLQAWGHTGWEASSESTGCGANSTGDRKRSLGPGEGAPRNLPTEVHTEWEGAGDLWIYPALHSCFLPSKATPAGCPWAP